MRSLRLTLRLRRRCCAISIALPCPAPTKPRGCPPPPPPPFRPSACRWPESRLCVRSAALRYQRRASCPAPLSHRRRARRKAGNPCQRALLRASLPSPTSLRCAPLPRLRSPGAARLARSASPSSVALTKHCVLGSLRTPRSAQEAHACGALRSASELLAQPFSLVYAIRFLAALGRDGRKGALPFGAASGSSSRRAGGAGGP